MFNSSLNPISPSPIVILEPTSDGYTIICKGDTCQFSLNQVAKQLHKTIVKVQEFFLETFSLKGIDGRGKLEPFVINWDERNAQWFCKSESCFWRFHNIYAMTPEVVAHEYMHGVIKNLNYLTYSFQSGALNESLADVIGIAFKQWLSPELDSKNRWSMGGLRDFSSHASMLNYSHQHIEEDFGGVHTNSAIPNHAFYRATVTYKSIRLMAQIWFISFLQADHNSTFNKFAQKTIETAKKIDPSHNSAIHIMKAWNHVGVLQVESEENFLEISDQFSRKQIVKTIIHTYA